MITKEQKTEDKSDVKFKSQKQLWIGVNYLKNLGVNPSMESEPAVIREREKRQSRYLTNERSMGNK